ncbi:MAG: calcium/sodium antiporter [Parcubacteria group bacterium]|nr:calcium/sodium antiporter [Parcubacteria group bacterium]
MTLLIAVIIFIVSLAVLVKGSDWLLSGAENVGLSLGLSPFVIGVILVGIGTSFPELMSGLAGVFSGIPEIVVANATGSNIANILLVVGTIAIIARHITIVRDLITLELPLLAISTLLFLGSVYDGEVTLIEAIILCLAYGIYIAYSFFSGEAGASIAAVEKTAELKEEVEEKEIGFSQFMDGVYALKDYGLLLVGAAAVYFGATYLVDSVITLSSLLNIAPGVISITAIAFGTSLPELAVSVRAVTLGKTEVAIGNILGSNAFNALMVVGIPGLFTTLPVDEQTLAIGVPAMALVTLIFIISAISKKIFHWEGMMFLLVYIFFMLKLFAVM